MKEKMEVNVGASTIAFCPGEDGRVDFRENKMQKFGRQVLTVGVEKTSNRRSVSDMNKNHGENEMTI